MSGNVSLLISLYFFLPDKPGNKQTQVSAAEWRWSVGASQQSKETHCIGFNVDNYQVHTLMWIRAVFLQEIARLQEENNKLKTRLRTLESQV